MEELPSSDLSVGSLWGMVLPLIGAPCGLFHPSAGLVLGFIRKLAKHEPVSDPARVNMLCGFYCVPLLGVSW